MKTTVWIFLIVSMVVLTGCSGGNVGLVEDPPVVVVKQPKITLLTISPDGGVLPYGDKLMISWESENADYCLLNNETVKTAGFVVKQLFADTNFSLLAKTDKLSSLPTEKSVKVGDWTTSDLGLITYSYWMLKSLRYIQDGVVVADLILTEEEKTNRGQFALDGKVYSNGIFSMNWSFGSPGHLLMNGWEEDYSVTKTELVIRTPSNYNSKPAIWEVTNFRSISQ